MAALAMNAGGSLSKFMKTLGAGVTLAGMMTAASSASAEVQLRHVDVFTNGEDGYHMYRIPSVTQTADGMLHAFAEGRLTSSADPGGTHIDLVYKHSTDGGRTWSAMEILDRHPDANLDDLRSDRTSASNSVALVDQTNNRMWVFDLRLPHGVGAHGSQLNRDDMQTWARYSDDQGQTWSQAQRITVPEYEDFYPNLGSGIQMSNGRLVVPATARTYEGRVTESFALYSDDHGQTWHAGELIPNASVNESQVVELANGDLFMSARQNGGGHRIYAVSKDGGETWLGSEQGLPMTAVASAVERYSRAGVDGAEQNRILMSLPEGGSGGARSNLVIRSNFDEAQSFVAPRLAYRGPAAYSDMVRLEKDEVGVLWERGPGTGLGNEGNQSITYTVFNRDFLEPTEATGQLASESFNYAGDNLGWAIGGNGWNSTWAGESGLGSGSNAGLVGESLEHPGVAIDPDGGAASLRGQAMARGLGVPLDLDVDQTYYLSMLVRRESAADADSGEYLDILLLDAEGNTQAAFGNGTGGHWFINALGETRGTDPGAAALGTTYFLVAKIAAQAGSEGADQLFLHAFAPGEEIPTTDADFDWLLTGTADENLAASLDRILIRGGDNAQWLVDELRVGLDWSTVVNPIPEPNAAALLGFGGVMAAVRRLR